MNERIKELAQQAGFFPEPNWDHTSWHAAGYNDTFEKFAELIVRECANFISPLGDWCGGHGEPRAPSTQECAKMLKKHFGVEE